MPESSAESRIAVDIGGTFTDVVLEARGSRYSSKVLTTHASPDDAVMQGLEDVLSQADCKPTDIEIVLHGTTLATNALIERKGARTAFLTTEGFRDILEMGFEKRFAQYNLDARRPAPLVARAQRFTVKERISASGKVVVPLDRSALLPVADAMRDAQIDAIAIGFLHAYAHPQHELEAAEFLAAQLPQATVCISSEVCPEMREYERFSTTVANAYVRPMMSGYLLRLQQRLSQAGYRCPTFLMMSGGGLTTLEQASRIPIRLVESGPAGGAILAAEIATSRGITAALAFDMGGTTAKIALIENGQPARSRSFEIAREYRDMKGSGLPVRIPVIEMVEIGAGGGSIARVDELDRIKVGPDSAGSDPGPVAYDRGGKHPTVTDANLTLGKIDPATFAGGQMVLDADSAADSIQRKIGDPLALNGLWPAAGVIEMVEENMANAARVHAVERGKEPSEYTMIAFGGGAPLHAARLAEKLGITQIIVPVGAGVGSAIGFLSAPVSYQVVRTYRCVLSTAGSVAVNELLDAMAEEAVAVASEGAQQQTLELERRVELRYLGQGHELSIELPSGQLQQTDLLGLRTRFESMYSQVYGLTMPEAEIECVSWSLVATTGQRVSVPVSRSVERRLQVSTASRCVYDARLGESVPHAIFARDGLVAGDVVSGPAIVYEEETSTAVPTGFELTVDNGDALLLSQIN